MNRNLQAQKLLHTEWEVIPIGFDVAVRSGVADTEDEAAKEARYAVRLLEAENIIAPDVP